MVTKHCLLVDRGIFMVDAILYHTDWIIDLLITDTQQTKIKYLNHQRIKQIYSMRELLDFDEIYNLQYETIRDYKFVQPLADAGFRRICNDYQMSRYDFYTSICFWNHFFDLHSIDYCIIVGLPHGYRCDAIVQEIAVRRKILCFNVRHSFLGMRCIFYCNEQKLLYTEPRDIDFSGLTHYLKKIDWDRGSIASNTDGYIRKMKKFVWKKCYSIFGMVGNRILWRIRYPHAEYAPNYVPCSVMEYVMASMKNYCVRRYCEAHSFHPDYNTPYIVYYLHMDPESTIQGQTDVVDSQLVMIKMLAESSPPDWKVYVAPHPVFDCMNTALMEYQVIPFMVFNSKLFYSKLISMEKVFLLSKTVSRSRLFENAKAVATIAGTVALEAVESHKPVLLFGASKTVYRYCTDFFHIDSLRSCKAAIESIANGFVPSYQDFEEQCQRYLFPETDEGWKQMIQTIAKNLE